MSDGDREIGAQNATANRSARNILRQINANERGIANRGITRPTIGRNVIIENRTTTTPLLTRGAVNNQHLSGVQVNFEPQFVILLPSRFTDIVVPPLPIAGRKIRFKFRLIGELKLSAGAERPRLEAIIGANGFSLEDNIAITQEIYLSIQRDIISTENLLMNFVKNSFMNALVSGDESQTLTQALIQGFFQVNAVKLKIGSGTEIAFQPRLNLHSGLVSPSRLLRGRNIINPKLSLSLSLVTAEFTLHEHLIYQIVWRGIPLTIAFLGKLEICMAIELIGWTEILTFALRQMRQRQLISRVLGPNGRFPNIYRFISRLYDKALLEGIERQNMTRLLYSRILPTVGLTYLVTYAFARTIESVRNQARREQIAITYATGYILGVFPELGNIAREYAYIPEWGRLALRGDRAAQEDMFLFSPDRMREHLLYVYNGGQRNPNRERLIFSLRDMILSQQRVSLPSDALPF
jgi:hypothetical protein